MRQKQLKFIAILLLGNGLAGLQAQEALHASGSYASGSGGSASYSAGQIVYTTDTGTNGSVAQGVQQPFEISIVTGIDIASEIDLCISAYPNPTIDFLILKLGNYNFSDLSYQLFDMQGKLIFIKNIESEQTTISMGNFTPGSYFLKLKQANKEVKTFKIIKY